MTASLAPAFHFNMGDHDVRNANRLGRPPRSSAQKLRIAALDGLDTSSPLAYGVGHRRPSRSGDPQEFCQEI